MLTPNTNQADFSGGGTAQATAALQIKNRQHESEHGHPLRALIQTFGCQQNESDSEYMAGMLEQAGFEFTLERARADVIIFNTCAVREHAEKRVFGNLGALKHLKADNPKLKIGLCGCMPQQPQIVDELLRKYRHVDFIFGTHTQDRLPEILLEAMTSEGPCVNILDDKEKISEGLPVRRKNRHKAYVSVMSGCNNFCSYCIVPYTRGREKSRAPEVIIREIEGLISEGCKEIMLLGQNVNTFGKDLQNGWNFPRLLREIEGVKGDFWLRFMSSHPKDLTQELTETIAGCKKVERHLHLAVQAGSDRVLALMNRGYTSGHYLELLSAMRRAEPEMSFSSDIMVGFPTETSEDFEDTLRLVEKGRFLSLYTFIYSQRKGTPAATMEGQLPREEKLRRFDRLLELQNSISNEEHQKMAGKTIRVLTDGQAQGKPGKMAGRSSQNHLVFFEGNPEQAGQFVNVTIGSATTWSLEGSLA